ncbi:MAG: cold shock domain-containing protein [Burkholderiaceae bacterium]
MRFEGNLRVWHGDRGFGAIVPVQGGQELFVHISAFPRDGAPPTVDEALSFEIVTDGDGRKQAVRVQRSQRGAQSLEQKVLGAMPRRSWHERRRERRRRIGFALAGLALLVVVIGWMEISRSGARASSLQAGAVDGLSVRAR